MENPSRSDRKRRYERAAKLYLQQCYGARTAARVSEFAEFVRLTRPHLSVEFKSLFGVTPLAYLRKLQLEHACGLLRASTATPAQVALSAAFGTVNTFYRTFNAALGVSPEAYRKSVNRTN